MPAAKICTATIAIEVEHDPLTNATLALSSPVIFYQHSYVSKTSYIYSFCSHNTRRAARCLNLDFLGGAFGTTGTALVTFRGVGLTFVLANRFKLQVKLGFDTSSSVWLPETACMTLFRLNAV